MPSTRKFFKTVLTVEVLSDESPLEWDSLADVSYAITDGDCSGKITNEAVTKLSGPEAAKALQDQGSEPEFFRLDEDGNDLED